ncbi:MAG: ankyrin repeat domain-containing protein [Calothrix sp. FI2-JRJ7]|jgi:ankyrin repeat protein|nr:ankyrin repeat domain-containing protein [Calothrix sp. FI2-JRJ7]
MKIHDFAKQGNIIGVKEQLACGVKIDSRDKSSQTPLMCACCSAFASLEMVQFLVECGADINAIGGECDYTVLGLAVQSGNIDKIQYLLDAGTDIHYQNPDGYDVLINAMYGRNIQACENLVSIVNLLISRGASVRGISKYGESALKAAAYEGRFDVVELLLTAGADSKQLGWTELMYAVAFGSVEETKRLIDAGADLNAWDSCNRTPWLLSLQVGDIEKAKLLLPSKIDRSKCETYEEPALMYAIRNNNVELLKWLIKLQFDVEATDYLGSTPLIIAAFIGATDCVKVLLEAGASASKCDNYDRTAIQSANNLEIIKMLVDAGEDLSNINDSMQQILLGFSNIDDISNISNAQYLKGKHRKFGKTNPEVMKVDFWEAMVRSGVSAWTARDTFNNTDNTEAVWCFQRFGRTITELPDGRIIQIGAEHEDFYDPDFCIYNDIVVHQGDGTFTILGYPKDVFPPTDFHSATLVGKYIYIIGCAGYSDDIIYAETPVYRLDCHTFKIEKIETTGEKPGWISRHKAFYQEPSQIYITGGKVSSKLGDTTDYIDSKNDYILDLKNMDWRRIIK